MSEFGEYIDGQFYRISDFELGLMRARADGVLAEPKTSSDADKHSWSVESKNHTVLRNMSDSGRDMLHGITFESAAKGTLVTEYVLSLHEGFFMVLRELHEGPVFMDQSFMAKMSTDTAKMLLELGQLKPELEDIDNLGLLLDEARADQAKKIEEFLEYPEGKPSTGRSIPIQFN